MTPTLPRNTIILASGWFRVLSRGDLVVFEHEGLDKIKRVKDINNDQIYVIGDNLLSSKDSRVFGWIPTSLVKARVFWPK